MAMNFNKTDSAVMMGQLVMAGTRLTVELMLENSLPEKPLSKCLTLIRAGREKLFPPL